MAFGNLQNRSVNFKGAEFRHSLDSTVVAKTTSKLIDYLVVEIKAFPSFWTGPFLTWETAEVMNIKGLGCLDKSSGPNMK